MDCASEGCHGCGLLVARGGFEDTFVIVEADVSDLGLPRPLVVDHLRVSGFYMSQELIVRHDLCTQPCIRLELFGRYRLVCRAERLEVKHRWSGWSMIEITITQSKVFDCE